MKLGEQKVEIIGRYKVISECIGFDGDGRPVLTFKEQIDTLATKKEEPAEEVKEEAKEEVKAEVKPVAKPVTKKPTAKKKPTSKKKK